MPETFVDGRILIVDDEEANVDLLEQTLARAGYRDVVATTDPRRSAPLFLERRPDLVLLDLHMPYLDGFAVLDQLRPHIPEGAYLPILVLTADITPEARQRALTAGARDFVTKPFDRIELLLRIHNLLETRTLHLRLQQQYDRMERLYDEAQAALRQRDESLSAITHDLGQPLTSIKVAAQLARRRADGGGGKAADNAWLAEELTSIDAATTKMWAMIGELRDVARLEAGRPLSLDWQPIDLVALVRQEAAAHQTMTDRHRVRLEAAEPHLVGEWDPYRLVRVVSNLLSNAVKYSPEGGDIAVTVAREAGDAAAGDRAVLRVRDEGVGIPAADLPHIFERFHRGANVAGRIDGAGIGLWGARQIVEQHGGTITIDSREGEGTTVTVRLPLA